MVQHFPIGYRGPTSPIAVELRLQAAIFAGDLLAVAAIFEETQDFRSHLSGSIHILDSCLRYASRSGQLPILRWLLDHSTDRQAKCLARRAVFLDEVATMDIVMARGKGISLKYNPLNLGLAARSTGMLKLFLRHGWDPNHRSPGGSEFQWR